MREPTPFEMMMAAEAAARHRTPKATVTHPKGVIVQGDELLTDNIRNDPDYVPYCGPCTPMQRMRRVEDGFVCPTCKNHTNWDLSPFNYNVDVQFDPAYVDPVWLEQHQKQAEAIRSHEAIHKETYARFKERQDAQRRRDWEGDRGKKNTADHDCGKCGFTFFGKKNRKFCRVCQDSVTQHLNQNAPQRNHYFYQPTRSERRGRG